MSAPSLNDFLKESRLTDCPVCKLSPVIRKQIVERKTYVTLADVIPWLRKLGIRGVNEKHLQGHFRSGHEKGRFSFRTQEKKK